jgi:hypothetical protein
MINGRISLEGAKCQLVEAEAPRVVDGFPTDEMIRTKKVQIWDPSSGFEVNLVFQNGEYEAFLKTLKGEE